MKTITVWLHEDKEHELFSHKKGDRVSIDEPGKDSQGTIINGKFTGKSNGGAFSITYTIQTDAGNLIKKEQSKIKKAATPHPVAK